MRYDDAGKNITQDYAGEGGFLYYLSSALLFWQTEADSCVAVNMARPGTDTNLIQLSGSMALLWPLFLTLCLSQFVETLSCALQGRQPSAETGMTIFEHSLAFAEAETAIIKPWEVAGKIAPFAVSSAGWAADSTDARITRAFLKGFMNVPSEVLLIALISSLSHLTSNVLAVVDMRKRFRLVNTSIWALSYMSAFVWAIYRYVTMPISANSSNAAALSLGLIRFPTVCVVGFIPHLVILLGICVCAIVYGLALLITAISPPDGVAPPSSIKERLQTAYQNLQANVHLNAGTSISVGWHDDFYTSLLKAGFAILTSASEAVYLNEGVRVKVASMTWLERKRYEELSKRRGLFYRKTMDSIPSDMRIPGGSIAHGMASTDNKTTDGATSGYGVERKSKSKDSETEVLNASQFQDRGVGFMQRHWRWAMALRYIQGIFWLAMGMTARSLLYVLAKARINRQPRWLLRLAGESRNSKDALTSAGHALKTRRDGLEFWMIGSDGSLRLPENNNVDVEVEMRRRINTQARSAELDFRSEDERVAQQCYDWWKAGGWWGDEDGSGEFSLPTSQLEDDTTSMISMSTNANDEVFDEDAWTSVSDDDENTAGSGQRTPTQEHPFPSYYSTRESTPFESGPINDALSASRLAELLDPQNREQQAEARMLARHLRNERGVMTRSRYNRQVALEQARILAHPGQRSKLDASSSGIAGMSPEEEERELESFILSRRANFLPSSSKSSSLQDFPNSPAGSHQFTSATDSKSWQHGAEGMGSSGPACVVCQHNPRTILVWPCGCLSMCDECRIGLATRNYSNCICCRTTVGAFSRIWVP